MLTATRVAEIVGNPVEPGRPNAGPEVCKWGTPNGSDTDLLLTVRLKGSLREGVLCDEVRKAAAGGKGVSGVGEVAVWQFSTSGSFFNSGELEVCSAKAYLDVMLNGKRDEATLKSAALAIAREVLGRL